MHSLWSTDSRQIAFIVPWPMAKHSMFHLCVTSISVCSLMFVLPRSSVDTTLDHSEIGKVKNSQGNKLFEGWQNLKSNKICLFWNPWGTISENSSNLHEMVNYTYATILRTLTRHWSHHSSKCQNREILAPRSKVPNTAFGRTTVEVQAYPGRKYQIWIFGRRAAKTGKKSSRETLHTIDAKFQRKILQEKIFEFYLPGCTPVKSTVCPK